MGVEEAGVNPRTSPEMENGPPLYHIPGGEGIKHPMVPASWSCRGGEVEIILLIEGQKLLDLGPKFYPPCFSSG